MTVLCHKCNGALSALPANSGLYGCHCISGWIRDWQVAIPIEEARALQEKAKAAQIAFKAEQDRNARIAHLYRREHHRKWWESSRPLEEIK